MVQEENNEIKQSIFSWSLLYNARKKIRERFPSIWNIQVIKKAKQVLLECIHDGYSVLDVGSCNRNLEKEILRDRNNVNYKSMDVDRSNQHDYYDINEINEKFDVVVMFECIEHLSLEDGAEALTKIYSVIKPGGCLIVSTPNTYHPNRYWECTHRVPFRYDELGGFLELFKFKTEKIYRVYNDSFILRVFRLYVTSYIHRYFNIDFAKSVIIVARNI